MTDSIGNRPLNWAERRAIVLDRAGYECATCGDTATEADHKWPRVAGGADEFANLQALCRSCNASKGDQLLYQHMTPEGLHALAAKRLDAAQAGVIGAARYTAMSALMIGGYDAREAHEMTTPGVDSIPAEWRRWVVDYLAQALDVPVTALTEHVA